MIICLLVDYPGVFTSNVRQVRVIEARNLAAPDRVTTESSGCDVSIEIKFVGEEKVSFSISVEGSSWSLSSALADYM
jgi:hypothetical protein